MKNQKGFANIILIALVVTLVGVLGYVTLVKKTAAPVAEPAPSASTGLPSVASTTPSTPASDPTAGWKTYRNEQYGFEFKYPSQINGKPATLVERKEYDDLLLFQSKISYGVPVEGKGGVMEQPYFENLVSFSARANSALSVGVDLGGQGGYTYDPVKDTWSSRDNPQQKLTWSEMYNYFSSSLPEGLPMVKTISGQNAFPYDGGAYESYWDGYRIFNTERRLFLHFYHFHGYVPESITTEVVKENKAIRKFLQGVTETVKFF